MAENNEIPANADKILFAEDLISYMMLRTAHIQFQPVLAEPYREFIYNGFNETTKSAVRFLDSTMEMCHDDIFQFMQNANSVNRTTYIRFAQDICVKYFPDGFDANNFLHYCVHLASLAAYFHNHGILEAPNLAVLYIAHAFQDFDMNTGGWDTLNRIAQRFASVAQDTINTLSPKSVDSEEDDQGGNNVSYDDVENEDRQHNSEAEDGNFKNKVKNLDDKCGSYYSKSPESSPKT